MDMSSPPGRRELPERRVVVRFKDDEILEGLTHVIDLDEPDFTLTLPGTLSGRRVAIIPVTSIKNVLLQRVELEHDIDRGHMSSVRIVFWDGDVLHGLLGSEPERRRYGMTLPLVSPALDEIEVLGIPYVAVKAVHIITRPAWPAEPQRTVRETDRWNVPAIDAPLLSLLGEIRRLTVLRTEGGITADDFNRRRREVLARI